MIQYAVPPLMVLPDILSAVSSSVPVFVDSGIESGMDAYKCLALGAKAVSVSCHLKDILLKPEYTFQLQECACGEGTLDINLYAQLATAENPCMPMIIEHLTTDEAYVMSVQYVKDRLSNQ